MKAEDAIEMFKEIKCVRSKSTSCPDQLAPHLHMQCRISLKTFSEVTNDNDKEQHGDSRVELKEEFLISKKKVVLTASPKKNGHADKRADAFIARRWPVPS